MSLLPMGGRRASKEPCRCNPRYATKRYANPLKLAVGPVLAHPLKLAVGPVLSGHEWP